MKNGASVILWCTRWEETANVEIVRTDGAGRCALVAVGNLPVAGLVILPSRAFRRVEDGVTAVFANI